MRKYFFKNFILSLAVSFIVIAAVMTPAAVRLLNPPAATPLVSKAEEELPRQNAMSEYIPQKKDEITILLAIDFISSQPQFWCFEFLPIEKRWSIESATTEKLVSDYRYGGIKQAVAGYGEISKPQNLRYVDIKAEDLITLVNSATQAEIIIPKRLSFTSGETEDASVVFEEGLQTLDGRGCVEILTIPDGVLTDVERKSLQLQTLHGFIGAVATKDPYEGCEYLLGKLSLLSATDLSITDLIERRELLNLMR